jgi:arylsulfatase A-like enzyme
MFAGELDMSKIKLPNDNGPFREGKRTLYEGGTRVISVAKLAGPYQASFVANEITHKVDIYPTSPQGRLDAASAW